MIMKSVAQRIKKDIEYFSALSEIYGRRGDATAHRAAQETVAALEKLLRTLDGREGQDRDNLPLAA
jgi:hypothetical protein